MSVDSGTSGPGFLGVPCGLAFSQRKARGVGGEPPVGRMWKRVWVEQPQLWGQLLATQPDLCLPCVMAHGYTAPQGARRSTAVSSVSVPARQLGSLPND